MTLEALLLALLLFCIIASWGVGCQKGSCGFCSKTRCYCFDEDD
jgi:hypothetical protein